MPDGRRMIFTFQRYHSQTGNATTLRTLPTPAAGGKNVDGFPDRKMLLTEVECCHKVKIYSAAGKDET